MNKRSYVRYEPTGLPETLSKVTVSWHEVTQSQSAVLDYSAEGIRIFIPPLSEPGQLPRESDEVKVLLPVDNAWLTGTCIHADQGADGSLLLGVHFGTLEDREHLRNLLTVLPAPAPASSFIKYEWEELIGRLCNSGDPDLEQLGRLHQAHLQARRDHAISA